MKKYAVLLMLACIVMMPFSAMADEVTWEAVGEPAAAALELQGDFVELAQLGLKIWIPSDLVNVEVEQEGRLAAFVDQDGDCYLTVDAVNIEGLTLDLAKENAINNGMTDVDIDVINGISAVTYQNTAENTGCIVLVDTNSNAIIFSFGPIDNEVAKIAFTVIASSIQPAE